MGRLGWVGVLVALGCSPPVLMEADEDTETGGEDEAPEEEAMDMQAVVYAVSSLDSPGGAYYLRRLGEEPILLGSSESSHVDMLCLMPDGTGYVRWWPRDDYQDNPFRMESFAIGEDWVEAGLPSPFPPEFNAAGCPMGWTPDAYFVNLFSYDMFTDWATGMPYRALPDGTVHPVLEANSHWSSIGDYAVERTTEHAVLWTIQGGFRQIARKLDDLTGLARIGGWLLLTLGDDHFELLSSTDIDHDPIPLYGTPTPGAVNRWWWFSPSGGGVAAAEYDEDWGLSSLDLLQIEDGILVQRHQLDVQPGMGWATVVTDSGRIVVAGDGVLWTASFDEAPTAIPLVEGEPVRLVVSEEEDLVIVEDTVDGFVTAYSVHDLRSGSSRAFVVPPSCELPRAVGEYGYFICDGTHFERVNLRGATLELESLESLTPDDSVEPESVGPRSWNGEEWHSLFYREVTDGANGGGVSVLLRADGTASLKIPSSNTDTVSPRFFPVQD